MEELWIRSFNFKTVAKNSMSLILDHVNHIYGEDTNLAVAALNLNPLVTSDTEANVIVDELLEAHKQYLPQFFGE